MVYWNETLGYTLKEKDEYTGRYCGGNTSGNYWKYLILINGDTGGSEARADKWRHREVGDEY